MYVTVQQVRDQDPTGNGFASWTDQEVTDVILKWQGMIEHLLGQWFESRALTLEIMGSGSKFLHFQVPIITVAALYVNGDPEVLDTDYYKVYNSVVYPDDRKNPKIELIKSQDPSIYTGAPTTKFDSTLIQKIEGTFGYVDESGSTPVMVQEALILVVVDHMGSKYITDPIFKKMSLQSKVTSEKLDKYSYKLGSFSEMSSLESRLYSALGNRQAAAILKEYRAPRKVINTD